MEQKKNMALVAHDHHKPELIDWVLQNYETLVHHSLVCTGTTGTLIEKALQKKRTECDAEKAANTPLPSVTKLKSGPLGGDQQLGALITEGRIDVLIFFWDPMQPQPHDVDVKALLRIAVVYNIAVASSRATADFLISSPLMNTPYRTTLMDYSTYINRSI